MSEQDTINETCAELVRLKDGILDRIAEEDRFFIVCGLFHVPAAGIIAAWRYDKSACAFTHVSIKQVEAKESMLFKTLPSTRDEDMVVIPATYASELGTSKLHAAYKAELLGTPSTDGTVD